MSKNIDLLSNEPDVVQKIRWMINESPKNFSGPSIYFHQKAIECVKSRRKFLTNKHIEYIYATLVSWGMHRMGPNGATMPDYKTFKESVLTKNNRRFFKKWRGKRIDDISECDFRNFIEELIPICFGIEATVSNSKLVSSSKNLAHILPDLVPPIDRQYTLKFFHMYDNHISTPEKAKNVFKSIMLYMFDFYRNKEILDIAKGSLDNEFKDSLPKIFDNVIIHCVKDDLTCHQKIQSKHSI